MLISLKDFEILKSAGQISEVRSGINLFEHDILSIVVLHNAWFYSELRSTTSQNCHRYSIAALSIKHRLYSAFSQLAALSIAHIATQ